MDHCAECGFEYDERAAVAAAGAVLAGASELAAILDGGQGDLRSRRASISLLR